MSHYVGDKQNTERGGCVMHSTFWFNVPSLPFGRENTWLLFYQGGNSQNVPQQIT